MKANRKRILVLAPAAAAVAAVGVTMAFMFRKADAENRFEPAVVTCTVHEQLNDDTFTAGTHTGDVKSNIRVENTGTYPAYVRVRLVGRWVNGAGETVGGVPSRLPAVKLLGGWLAGSGDTYYYTTAMAPGDMTGVLCEPMVLETGTGLDGSTSYQVVEVFAEAIQAAPEEAGSEAAAEDELPDAPQPASAEAARARESTSAISFFMWVSPPLSRMKTL